MRESAGILLYRGMGNTLEVLIGHPGGPLWASKNEGAWSIVKGEIDAGEEPLAAAGREFEEETGSTVELEDCVPLGEVRQKAGKVVTAWACPGELDPARLDGGTFELEWPPRSGRVQEFPELDEVRWCTPSEARRLLNPAQEAFVDRLESMLA